jgi:uncharacterized protein YndB with AHSA1/START domain
MTAIILLLAIIFVVAALRPAAFCVARSTTIAAPPHVVFEHVNDLKKFQQWDPWSKMDPTTRHSYSGPVAGVGAAQSWTGKKTGVGQMTITESRPGELVRMRLEFIKPFAATNTVDFTFRSEAGRTVATWSMSGVNNFFFRLMGLFMSMEKICGPQFESGLADLKTLAEAAAKK